MQSESEKKVTKRKDWVDALRALAMFFVILGHLLKGKTGYFVFTSPIKLPLFFMITGYVFNYRRTEPKAFLYNLFHKVVVPWLCLTVPFVFLKAPVKGLDCIPTGIFKILSGAVAWYMVCLIIAEIIWFYVFKFGKTPFRISCLTIIIGVMGIVAGKYHVLDFAMINVAMTAQIYLLLGFLFKNYEDTIQLFGWETLIPLAFLYLAMGYVSLKIWPHSCIDIHLNYYYNYPYCFSMIFLGCLTVFASAKRLHDYYHIAVPGIIRFLGQNTMVFYLLHGYNTYVVTCALRFLNVELPEVVLVILKLGFAYVGCGIETRLILRFFPWMLGRKRVKHTQLSQ